MSLKLSLILFFIGMPLFADCSNGDVLFSLRPGATWVMKNDNPSTLIWSSTQTLPSKAELNQAVSNCISVKLNKETQRKQAMADAKDTTKDVQTRLNALVKAIDSK